LTFTQPSVHTLCYENNNNINNNKQAFHIAQLTDQVCRKGARGN